MKLEINQQIVSENATKEIIAQAIHNLRSDDLAIILLSESEDIFLQAGGVPESGLMMSYINPTSGDDLQSKNHSLSPKTIERVFKHFVDGDSQWREIIGWENRADIQTKAKGKPTVSKKTRGLLFGCFLYLTFLYPLMAIGLDIAIKKALFIPMCARHGVAVVSYAHGGGGVLQGTYHSPRCTFANGTTIDLSDIVGWNVTWLDSLMRLMVGVLPFTIPVVIGVLAVMQVARERARRDASPVSS